MRAVRRCRTARVRRSVRGAGLPLTKAIAECHDPETDRAAAHERRLSEEIRWTPCSSRCPNWLLYGIQPQGAKPEMIPGCCPGKAHKRHTPEPVAGPTPQPEEPVMKPVIYGYLRVTDDLEDHQIRRVERALQALAEAEGFRFATTFRGARACRSAARVGSRPTAG